MISPNPSCFHDVEGFCSKAGALNLLVVAYPQIMLNPLGVRLNNNLTQIVPLNEKMANFMDKKDQNGLFSRRF
jgi:hypothetical protein